MVTVGRCFSTFDKGEMPYKEVKDLGYSYIEVPLAEIEKCNLNKLEEISCSCRKVSLDIYSSNLFFPSRISLLNEETSENAILDYTENALSKAEYLGVKIAVLGSGGARRKPETMDVEEARKRLIDIFGKISYMAQRHGVTLALEPLNSSESNVINTIKEGFDFVSLIAQKNFRLLADYYHMSKERENLEVIENVFPVLVHVHLATPERIFPAIERFDEYRCFLEELNRLGYEGGISVECDFGRTIAESSVCHIDSLFG